MIMLTLQLTQRSNSADLSTRQKDLLQTRLGRVNNLRVKSCLLLPVVGLCGLLFLPIAAPARLTPEQAKDLPAPASRQVDFLKDVKPILSKSCGNCHGYGRDKGGFQIDTRETLLKGGESGPAVLSGKSQTSLLIELVSG